MRSGPGVVVHDPARSASRAVVALATYAESRELRLPRTRSRRRPEHVPLSAYGIESDPLGHIAIPVTAVRTPWLPVHRNQVHPSQSEVVAMRAAEVLQVGLDATAPARLPP